MAHYPGYTVLRTEDCPEQHGTLTLLTHDVSGAAVLLVENEDVNKAFGIGFGTFPSDDTGVFHILEHSVLAGSEKYPVSSPFVQLLKSSMASFLNAMTFPDKTVYPFATPNETDFCNLMDVYLNAVFCPLAMVDSAVFEQEGWHRDADGTVSGVVYNEMQGALASPDAQLQNALQRAMFPDTAYGFVSGGDPASIPALTYEKYQRVYRRHYSADNCCITLYGKMDMADKLARLDKDYLSKMPKAAARPRLTMQDEQPGAFVELPYYTDQPKPDEVQCALAWYTGAFADRERQLGVEILLGALLSTNSSPLKAALLAEQLGADIDIGFDDSTLQPTLELLLRGATVDSARKFAPAVRKAVDELLKTGIPHDLLLAALNEAEFASLERPGSLPDGVLDAINASTGWLHTGDPALLLHTDKLFASLRSKMADGWFDELLRNLRRDDVAGRVVLIKGSRDSHFERVSHALERKSHTTVLEVDLDAMIHNLNYFRARLRPGVRLVAMVKAASYGAGDFEVAQMLQHQGVNYLAVAFADEGVLLRERGIRMPIVVLNADEGSFDLMVAHRLEPEIYNFRSLAFFSKAVERVGEESYPIHIKLDTGMHRLGFMEGELDMLTETLGETPSVKVATIFSHLNCSDMPQEDRYTREQIARFDRMSGRLAAALPYPVLRHTANSAAIERFPEAQFDMCRLGLGLYGFGFEHNDELKPVSTLKSRIVQLKHLSAGEAVGYGRAGKLTRDSVTATVPMGYADGLDRHLGCGRWSMLVAGRPAPIVGRVCMDSCMIDVTDIPGVEEGDEVVIFSAVPGNTPEDMARVLDTIPYEVMTSVSGRVKRIYSKE